MVTPKYINLDSIPISARHYETPGNSNPNTELNYREELNLGLNIVHTEASVSKRQKALSQYYQTSRNQLTLKDLKLVLESNLYLLTYASTISSLDNSKLSSHYSKWKAEGNIQPINEAFLRELLYTETKTWGGKRGSLAYCLHLKRSIDHYSHISDIVNNCLEEQFKDKVSIKSLLLADSTESDFKLYEYSYTSLLEFPDFKVHVEGLQFIQSWIPKVVRWYLDAPKEDTDDYKYLASYAIASLQHNQDYTSYNNLVYRFSHQQLSLTCLDLYEEMLGKRVNINFSVSDLSPSSIKNLLQELVDTIPIYQKYSYRVLATDLINNYFPLGGLNTCLTSIAAGLLNKAYILCNAPYQAYSLYEDANPQDFKELLGRVFRLIYLSGYCLKKGSLDHLNIMGVNLTKLSGLQDKTTNRIYEVLK